MIESLGAEEPMGKSQNSPKVAGKTEWSSTISELRRRLGLSQTAFGQRLYSSAMAVSRWERGTQEPTAESYIGLGNLAGDPLCWFFWGRAGLSNEDLMRVLPTLRTRLNNAGANDYQLASAGSGHKRSKIPQLVAIPLLGIVAASHGEKGDNSSILHGAPVESMMAAPTEWCLNPTSTICLRVRGNSMSPLISDGSILAVDTSQRDPATLDGKIIVTWHKKMGLSVSRLKRYGPTEVLQPENREYESVVLNGKQKWRILAKVLWWIGKAP
jgi:SOS-response transcriptional repressor LexA